MESIAHGWLTWHAFPFNSEAELHSPDMLVAGFDRCHALDDEFRLPHKSTMSQRDVPGTTRSSIPVLLDAGVTVFSEGVNGASTPPFVPRAFSWLDPNSKRSLVTLIHPYGYGDIGIEDAVIVPGLSHALVFAWRGDNAGPPESIDEIESNYATVRKEFPGARVFASTFDNFTSHLLAPDVVASLPVITAELGDTWVHGAPSDPVRVAFFKRAGELRSACLASGACIPSDAQFQNFTRLLLKCGEHTWGADIKGFLHDTTHWKNSELQAQLAGGAPNFEYVLHTWVEQRAWCIDYSIAALGNHPLGSALTEALADLRPTTPPSPAAQGYAPYAPGKVYTAGRWAIAFDATTGAISMLKDSVTGQVWASPADGSKLCWMHYVTLSSDDYAVFTGPEPGGYYPQPGDSPGWFKLDFGKPNVSEAAPIHQEIPQQLSSLWLRESQGVASFLVQATFGADILHTYYGAPADMWLRFDVPMGAGSSINASVEIYNKTATRLPEGLFLRFNASASYGAGGAPAPLGWRVNKLGGEIDPFDVVPGGAHHNHGFAGPRGGVTAVKADPSGVGATARLSFHSDSAGVASAGNPVPLPAPVFANSSDAACGTGFLLIDNTWGTNYPMWVPFVPEDTNLRWRFTIDAE